MNKNILILILFCFLTIQNLLAQSFTSTTNVAIPDAGAQVCSGITVTGVGTIDGTYGLTSVCIKINHTYDGDLDIYLVAPDGTIIELSTDNGGSGNNYGNGGSGDGGTPTCFEMTASTPITSGSAPFQNTYIPEGDLSDANNGQNANGIWNLCITDDSGGDTGFINSWQLTFDAPPTPPSNDLCIDATALPCGTTNLAGTTENTTNVSDPTGCSNTSNYGVWYTFTGDGNLTTISASGLSMDIGMAIVSGNCSSFSSTIVCVDDYFTTESHTFTTTSGVDYYVYIAYYGSGSTTGTFDISRTCSAPPAPSCSDGIQNGDETGVDCGGSLCGPCTVPAELCEDANPFCSDLVYNFPTTVDAADAVVGPDYGCLGSQPNPVWYFLQIDANGDLEIEIASDCGDVDYAAWGPFPAVTCDNSDLTTSGNFMYEFVGASTDWEVDAFSAPSGNMVDCSYDIDAIEYLSIPNGVIGDYYVVLITNYDNCDGLLTFSQTSGTGSSNCSIVLPIDLLSFTGYSGEGYNLLEWITTSEINNDYFEIEKSNDGILFNKIDVVDGIGNSSVNNSYQYIDNNSNSTISYYRLKQIDYDGKHSYSNIVAIKKSIENEITIFPNPTLGSVKLNFDSKEDKNYQITVYDISKEIYQEKIFVDKGLKTISFDLFEKLSKGFYILKITDQNGNEIKTERIIKH